MVLLEFRFELAAASQERSLCTQTMATYLQCQSPVVHCTKSQADWLHLERNEKNGWMAVEPLTGEQWKACKLLFVYLPKHAGEAKGFPPAPNATLGFAETFGCGVCQGQYAAQLTSAWEVSALPMVFKLHNVQAEPAGTLAGCICSFQAVQLLVVIADEIAACPTKSLLDSMQTQYRPSP